MMLIQNYGLYWQADQIFWGIQRKKGALWGKPSISAKGKQLAAVDFFEQTGIYVLYADYKIVYIGQTGGATADRLLPRLRDHTKGPLAGRWNQFSWFGTRKVLNTGDLSKSKQDLHVSKSEALNHIEGILLCVSEPPLNRQGPKFGNTVTQYLQLRDDRLGPTPEEMIQAMWQKGQLE